MAAGCAAWCSMVVEADSDTCGCTSKQAAATKGRTGGPCSQVQAAQDAGDLQQLCQMRWRVRQSGLAGFEDARPLAAGGPT